MMLARLLSVAVGAAALAAGCARPVPTELVKSAKLGVFFGGQVEERREIAFDLDPGKQSMGFRVEFSAPLATDTDVEWRVDMPSTEKHKKKLRAGDSPPPEHATLDGKDVARAGETSLDHVLSFHPGDPLGLWNVRVVVRGKVVIDRPVEVYDASARKRLMPKDGG